MQAQPINFSRVIDAYIWMTKQVDDPHIDNVREAWADDEAQKAHYREIRASGCCGSFDRVVKIKGRRMWIGCNYGH